MLCNTIYFTYTMCSSNYYHSQIYYKLEIMYIRLISLRLYIIWYGFTQEVISNDRFLKWKSNNIIRYKKGNKYWFFLDVLWLSFCVYSDPDWSSGLTAEKIPWKTPIISASLEITRIKYDNVVSHIGLMKRELLVNSKMTLEQKLKQCFQFFMGNNHIVSDFLGWFWYNKTPILWLFRQSDV